MMSFMVLLAIGYLLGSLSPGYFFGRIVKGIDVRKYGNRNTGATNTYRIVGPAYGIAAGIFDLLKSAFAYYLGIFAGLRPELAIFVGLAAVFGHIAPFYLRFRGGLGAASLWGLNFAFLIYGRSLYALVLLAASVLYSMKIARGAAVEAPVRKAVKLAALYFPLSLIWLPQAPVALFAGALLSMFLAFDAVRFLAPALNRKYLKFRLLAKAKETKSLSGYTLFLVSAFFVLMVFPQWIAVLTLTIFILGDILAPIFGRAFLAIPIAGQKTIGGFAVFLGIGFVAGEFLGSLAPFLLTFWRIVSASLAAAALDIFSSAIDDNLLVPLGTACILGFLAFLGWI